MSTLITILVIFFFFWIVYPLVLPYVKRWMQRRLQKKFENMMRQAMGMPPEDDKKKHKRNKKEEASSSQSYNSGYAHGKEPIIPREYAEDVEFVEIKTQSESVEIHSDDKGVSYTVESQVSDVEYTIIKDS